MLYYKRIGVTTLNCFILLLNSFSDIAKVMKKISNEIKRMLGCLFSNEEFCYWPTMYSNKGVTQNGNTID